VAVVYIGMGSNLGSRLRHLTDGLRAMRALGPIRCVSDVIETDPVGPPDQPPYLNLVAEVVSDLSPLTLLRAVKEIERRAGRRPTYRWGPRVLDIDLLLYDGLRMETPVLNLPHPRMRERDFVMQPLAQIAPDVADRIRR
jgi:2-amino-4-hydroxy-6-hydroxymethyldihydropteridine diphosphokinase